MARRSTCIACRTKKVKCDGQSPACGPCLRGRKNLACTFEDVAVVKPKAKPLVKGKACLPCRRKKKRCTGVLPCEACIKIGKENQCVDGDFPVPRRSRQNKPLELFTSCQGDDLLPGYVSTSPILLTAVVTVSRSPSPRNKGQELLLLDPNMSLCDFPAIFLNVEPVFIPNPFVPLVLTDVEDPFAFALSDISMDDLNMNFRITFLSHRLSFGFYLPFAKQQAILMKDTSGTFVPPFFVHFSHMFGCYFFQERRFDSSLTYLQSMHVQLCWESLLAMREEDDPLQKAQAWMFMASGSVYTHNITRAKHYLKRCLEIVKRNNIRMVENRVDEDAISSSTLELTEESHERVAFLGQLVYWLNYLYLLDGHFEDCSDLESQFRIELPSAYPMLFKICPITLRVGVMLCAKEANSIMSQCNEKNTATAMWLATCWAFIEQQVKLLEAITSSIADFARIGDKESCLSLGYSKMISLTTLAELCHILARSTTSSSSSSEFQDKCNEALEGVVHLVQPLDPDDFRCSDPFLGICWSRAISLFRNEEVKSPLSPYIPGGFSMSSPRPSFDHLNPLPDEKLTNTINALAKSHGEFIRVRYVPTMGSRLCQRMAVHDFRRNPNAPNFLRLDVQRFYGL